MYVDPIIVVIVGGLFSLAFSVLFLYGVYRVLRALWRIATDSTRHPAVQVTAMLIFAFFIGRIIGII